MKRIGTGSRSIKIGKTDGIFSFAKARKRKDGNERPIFKTNEHLVEEEVATLHNLMRFWDKEFFVEEREGEFEVMMMDIDRISPSEKLAHPEYVEGLKKDMIANKPMMPIAVDMNDVIVDGHHRYEAARQLGIKKVPVITVLMEPEEY